MSPVVVLLVDLELALYVAADTAWTSGLFGIVGITGGSNGYGRVETFPPPSAAIAVMTPSKPAFMSRQISPKRVNSWPNQSCAAVYHWSITLKIRNVWLTRISSDLLIAAIWKLPKMDEIAVAISAIEEIIPSVPPAPLPPPPAQPGTFPAAFDTPLMASSSFFHWAVTSEIDLPTPMNESFNARRAVLTRSCMIAFATSFAIFSIASPKFLLSKIASTTAPEIDIHPLMMSSITSL